MIAPNRYRFYRFRSMIPWLIMIMSNAWRVYTATSNQINSTERVKNSRPFSQTCFSWQVVQAWDSRTLASLTRPYSSHTHSSSLASLDCSRFWHVQKCGLLATVLRALRHAKRWVKALKPTPRARKCKLLNVKNTLPFPKEHQMFFTWLQKVSLVFDAASIHSEFSPSQERNYRGTHVDLFL